MNTPSRRPSRRLSRRNFSLTVLSLGLALGSAALPALAFDDPDQPLRSGKVFTTSNSTAGNELLVYAPQPGGGLDLLTRAATDGLGSGAGLGSQAAVALSTDGRFAFVVNARSNTLSTFALRGAATVLTSVVDSGGLQPISVAEHDGLVYVLNADGDGNVAGFRNLGGQLRPLADGRRGLSVAGGAGPAQVGFGTHGDVLVVTEKNTNVLSSYQVRPDGSLAPASVKPSPGPTPFGFAFDRRDHLIVSEAFGGAGGASAVSSYRVGDLPARAAPPLRLLSASVPTGQTAACWIAVTPDGRHAYAANAGSSSISSYRIDRSGRIALVESVAGSTGANAGALDIAVSADGRRLYALAPNARQIVGFSLRRDGSLLPAGAATGLPAGSVGLAAN